MKKRRECVVAEWFTPMLDLGTMSESKTLCSMSISANKGMLRFGYRTLKNTEVSFFSRDVQGLGAFSFDDFSFDKFSFGNGFASSYTVRCRARKFGYIQFGFVSEEDAACEILDFSADYKVNSKNRGVV